MGKERIQSIYAVSLQSADSKCLDPFAGGGQEGVCEMFFVALFRPA